MRRKKRSTWVLLIISSAFALLRFPSLIEPNWYADEGIYQVVGRAMLSGRVLYQGIWDNKPPVLYIIYALVDGNLFLVKLLSLVSGLLSVIAFFYLSTYLFKKEWIAYVSTAIYALLFALPILEGNIANAENFMLLPIIVSAICILRFIDTKKHGYLMFAGLLLSFAFMTKIVAIFDCLAFLTYLIIAHKPSSQKFIFLVVKKFIFPFLFLLAIFSLYFLAFGAFNDFISSVFFQNVSYVGKENVFLFPMGLLVFKTIILCAFVFGIIYFRNKISTTTLFIYLWIVFSTYNAFFSDRPYTHYMLVALPAFSLLVGHILEYKKSRMLDALILVGAIYLAMNHFELYRKNVAYYRNFTEMVSNKKTITQYQSFFDANTPLQYDIANFIKSNVKKDESVFLWSDNAQIYALSDKLPVGKYIVAYHVTFYKHADTITKMQIEKSRPKYIIQTIQIPLDKDILSSYRLKYIMEGVTIYERAS